MTTNAKAIVNISTIDTVHRPSQTGLAAALPTAVQPPARSPARSHHHFTPAKLEAFVVVAEEGGFSAASRRLHVSQPALSQTINALERQVGVDLFVRSSTGVQTTPAGRALLHEGTVRDGHDRAPVNHSANPFAPEQCRWTCNDNLFTQP